MSENVFTVRPIAFVRSPRVDVSDDFWGAVESEIELCPDIPPESIVGLEDYSHVDILYVLDRVPPDDVEFGLRASAQQPGLAESRNLCAACQAPTEPACSLDRPSAQPRRFAAASARARCC